MFKLASLLQLALVLATPSLVQGGEQTPAHRPCDRIVSYFLYPYQGSPSQNHEWWIFDPGRGSNTLYLSFPGDFNGVRWDTTYANVLFSSGDSLYSAEWKWGAKAQLITRLPTGHSRWWFNPDKGCWQALCGVKDLETDTQPRYSLHEGELWQSSRDGMTWQLIRADTLEYIETDDDRMLWTRDRSQLGAEVEVITLANLASEAWEESWAERMVPMDTSNVTLLNDDARGSGDWFFVPFRVAPRRGVAFKRGGSGAPEHDWMGAVEPFYTVDLDGRTKSLIEGTGESAIRSLVAEHCGVLLVPGGMGNPLVIDPEGRVVFRPPGWNTAGAVWVPAPRLKASSKRKP